MTVLGLTSTEPNRAVAPDRGPFAVLTERERIGLGRGG
jgi:hypothetical protein